MDDYCDLMDRDHQATLVTGVRQACFSRLPGHPSHLHLRQSDGMDLHHLDLLPINTLVTGRGERSPFPCKAFPVIQGPVPSAAGQLSSKHRFVDDVSKTLPFASSKMSFDSQPRIMIKRSAPCLATRRAVHAGDRNHQRRHLESRSDASKPLTVSALVRNCQAAYRIQRRTIALGNAIAATMTGTLPVVITTGRIWARSLVVFRPIHFCVIDRSGFPQKLDQREGGCL